MDYFGTPDSQRKEQDTEFSARVGCDTHRRVNFLKHNWETNYKGNLVFRYKDERITAIERNGCYGFVYHNRWVWYYKGRKIRDLETLKLAAFEVFDNEFE